MLFIALLSCPTFLFLPSTYQTADLGTIEGERGENIQPRIRAVRFVKKKKILIGISLTSSSVVMYVLESNLMPCTQNETVRTVRPDSLTIRTDLILVTICFFNNQ